MFEDSLPTTLAEREREQSAETKASQKQADNAHIMAHSDRRAREKVVAQTWVHHDDDLYNKSHVRDEADVKDSGRGGCDLWVQSSRNDVRSCQSVYVTDTASGRAGHG
jgi:hypothetical protein